MNYVWKKNEIDSEAREAKNGSNIIESRNWSNKKLVCFPIIRFWALHYDFSHLSIDWSSSHRELRQISFSFTILNPWSTLESGEKVEEKWTWNHFWFRLKPVLQCNWRTRSDEMQIYSSPTSVPQKFRCQNKSREFTTFNCTSRGYIKTKSGKVSNQSKFASHNDMR